MPAPVVIVPHDPDWTTHFVRIRSILREALGEVAVDIHHVGSTAVPGLAAKPIVDIDIEIASVDLLPQAITRLAAIGYGYRGDLGVLDRYAFDPRVTCPGIIPYVCPSGGRELGRHLAFRDFLRNSPADAGAYAALKYELARRYGEDREGYSLAKTAFVEEILAKAG